MERNLAEGDNSEVVPCIRMHGSVEFETAVEGWHVDVLAYGCEDGHVGLMGENDKYWAYRHRHRGAVRSLLWHLGVTTGECCESETRIPSQVPVFEWTGSVSGGYDLLSLGTEGCLLRWPSIFGSDWRGAANDTKNAERTELSAAHGEDPTNVSIAFRCFCGHCILDAGVWHSRESERGTENHCFRLQPQRRTPCRWNRPWEAVQTQVS